MKLPKPPSGIIRQQRQIASEDGGSIRLTIYQPEKAAGPLPCMVYLHGGGFCLGDAWYIHHYAAQYAANARCIVVFLHYRTADIAPFPVPFQDCYDALRWVWEHSAELCIDQERIAVGGDSAGGALAAACALRARDEGKIRLCFQMLIYLVTDSRLETASMHTYTDSPLWNAKLNRKMWDLYLRGSRKAPQEYAAPMLADSFENLPPAYVEVEEFDCLRDEGLAYAQALMAAGVPVQLEDVKGTFHGFDVFHRKNIAHAVVQKRANSLRQIFTSNIGYL